MNNCIIVGPCFEGRDDYRDGTVALGVGDKEFLRIEQDGSIYVDDRLVHKDAEIGNAFVNYVRAFSGLDPIPYAPAKACQHEYVNAGFTSVNMVCKHCGASRD